MATVSRRVLLPLIALSSPLSLAVETAIRTALFTDEMRELRLMVRDTLTPIAWWFVPVTAAASMLGVLVHRMVLRRALASATKRKGDPDAEENARVTALYVASSVPQLPALVGQSRTDASRGARRAVKRVVPDQSTEVGDWVFFHLAQQSLGSFRLCEDDFAGLRLRLVSQSPVALLFAPAGERSRRELRDAYVRLTSPSTARVLECIEDRLAMAWTSAARTLWAERMTGPLAARIERWAALGRKLDAYLDAVDDAERLDLARPVTKLAAALMTGVFVGPAEEVRSSLSQSSGVVSLAQRDELLAAVASVTAVGQRVFALRERMAAERYGDARYGEAQVFLGDVDALLGGQRRAVEGLARSLSGVLG